MALTTISIRVYPNIEDLYRKLLSEEEPKPDGKQPTAGEFFEMLLENYQNPRKVEVSKKEDAAEIARLTNRITELETAIRGFDESSVLSLTEKDTRITDLEHQVFITTQELALLRENNPNPGEPSENSISIELTDDELARIEEFKATLAKRGYDITPPMGLFYLIRDGKIKGDKY